MTPGQHGLELVGIALLTVLHDCPAPEDGDIRPGDLVYLKVNDCYAPLPQRAPSPDAPRPRP